MMRSAMSWVVSWPLVGLVASSALLGCDSENPPVASPGGGFSGTVGSGAGQGGNAGGGAATGPVTGTPVEQCKVVLDTLCRRLVECDTGILPEDVESEKAICRQALGVGLPCERATEAGPSVSQCVADLNALSCASFLSGQSTLPGSCSGTFTFTASMAQMQCEALAGVLCKRILECDSTITDLTQEECQAATAFDLECDLVEGVSSTYDMCMNDMATLTCEVLFPPPNQTLDLPQSCFEVLL